MTYNDLYLKSDVFLTTQKICSMIQTHTDVMVISEGNSMSLINKAQTKKFILEQWSKHRNHEITCVSKETIDILEAYLKFKIIKEIKCHPSVGKTFKII